jgi:SAM-dependent methyltransferase
MSLPATCLINKHFAGWEHPYRTMEREVDRLLNSSSSLLDVGCGRTAPVLQKYRGRARRLIGVDQVDFTESVDGVELYQRDMTSTELESGSVDVAMARSVMEHAVNPEGTYAEMYRILVPGGSFVFLTANVWDYATIIARLIPNRFHPWIVHRTEGRAEEDVFPTVYKSNSRRQVEKLAKRTGFVVSNFQFLGQYPNYLLFSRPLFMMGAAYEKFIARHSRLNWLRGWILVTLRKPTPN